MRGGQRHLAASGRGAKTLATALCALSLAALTAPVVAVAAGGTPVELIGGDGARTIPLTVASVPNQQPHLAGTLPLTLVNTSEHDQTVTFLLANQIEGPTTLAHDTMRPGQVEQFPLAVTLPEGREPDALDGTILIQTQEHGAATASTAVSIPVTAAIAPIGDVRFAPNPVVVQVTRGCLLFHCNTTDGGTVQLVGSGVPSLLAALRAAGNPPLTTQIRSGSNTVPVEVTHLAADPGRPGVATGTLRLGRKPPPGAYKGTIALSALLPQAPTLQIEANSRLWFVWAFLALLLGVVAAGYVNQQLSLSRRKTVLEEMMEAAVGEYCEHSGENSVEAAHGETTLIWDLKITCPLRPNPDWTYSTELDSPANIYTAIKWARNADDITEAEAAAVPVVRNIKTWLLAVNEIRGLWNLNRQPHRLQGAWEETKVAWDTRLALSRARHTPHDAEAATKLRAAIELQTQWHLVFAEAWDLRAQLAESAGPQSVEAMHVDLAGLANEIKPVFTRSSDEQDECEVKLEMLRARLNKLAGEADVAIEVTPLADPQRSARSARLRSEITALAAPGPIDFAAIQASQAIASEEEPAAVPPGAEEQGDAPVPAGAEDQDGAPIPPGAEDQDGAPIPALSSDGGADGGREVPVATPATPTAAARATAVAPAVEAMQHAGPVDAPQATGVAIAAPADGNGAARQNGGAGGVHGTQRVGALSRASRVRRGLQRIDFLVSAGIVISTTVTYAISTYGPSWGSVADVATALGAGLAGSIVVNWAVLPIYRSLRVKTSA